METREAKNVVRTWAERVHKSYFLDGTLRIDIYRDIREMEKALREKRIDVVSTVSDDFVRLREKAPLQPLMVSATRGGVYQQLVVLARRDRGFRQLTDLRGKRLAVAGDKAQSIHFTWIETLLMREGYRTPSDFFSSVKGTVKPSQAILSVFFRQADACLTTRGLFEIECGLNPQLGNEMAVLAASGDMVTGVVAIHPEYDPKNLGKLKEVLETMDRTPSGKQFLQIFRVDHFVPFREEYLASVEALVKEHDRLRATLAGVR